MGDMTTILIVEDDEDIAELLELFFQNEGYATVHVDDGNVVVAAVKQHTPDLIVMDLMLPNQDGIVCTQAIREFSNVPIMMLTARIQQIEKLQGLEVGADDYICKPFDVHEMVLRAKAILRRTEGQVSFSQWTLDADALLIKVNGHKVELSALEFSLFKLLFDSPKRVYSRDQIIELAYPDYRDITDRAIDTHVKKIRKKFKQVGLAESPIQSVYGAGYRFLPDVN